MSNVQAEISERLDQIERTHDVRILYACEAGSRVWGFNSADSDYDIRFIYIHRPEWYLHINQQSHRQTIQAPIEGVFDFSGWDIRKALCLLNSSNPSLLEWARSPIVYRQDTDFFAGFMEHVEACTSIIRLRHHYLGMAETAFGQIRDRVTCSRKSYLYALRGLLVSFWFEQQLGQPPLDFSVLLACADSTIPTEVNHLIRTLLHDKVAGFEKDTIPTIPLLNTFIIAEFARLKKTALPSEPQHQSKLEQLNELFLRHAYVGLKPEEGTANNG